MSVEHARAVAVGPGGLNLTPFSRLVCRHPDYEVHFVQLNIMIARTQLPLRLAVAAFLRTLTEMVVAAVPEEMRKSSLVLTSGQVLFPFEDSPHITHDGVILHGRSAPQRAMAYRILYQTECLPSPGCAVGLGQARPPEPGEAFVAFPFMQFAHLAGSTCNHKPPRTTDPTMAHAAACSTRSCPSPRTACRIWWSQGPATN